MSSSTLDTLIQSLQCLPGIGQKSAQRMALHLLERDQAAAKTLADSISTALETVRHCQQCRNFSDSDLCAICAQSSRDQTTVCIVETPADVFAMESSNAFRGRYFVLLGRLSPLDGYGPEQLGLEQLETQFKELQISELILATSATVEGEITAQYIVDIASRYAIDCSRLARGIPMGGELEFVDSGTLSRAFSGRQPLE